ncbi:MAG: hypothetical protein AAF696_29870 [Bacteroidota bacterium]
MDVWEIYHNSFERELDSEELDFLDTMIRKYPYFAMARFLKAKAKPTTTNIGLASAHAPNRPLLKAFMEGKKNIKESKHLHKMNKGGIHDNIQKGNKKHELFSIVDIVTSKDKLPNKADFGILEGSLVSEDKFQGFLDGIIKEKVQKYKKLAKKIADQVREETGPELKAADDLIKSFLEKNPKIRRPSAKENFEQTEKLAVESVHLDEEIVSETLAKIHLKQNNQKEALKIYQKLRLLFPEKSAYFDAQIFEINRK